MTTIKKSNFLVVDSIINSFEQSKFFPFFLGIFFLSLIFFSIYFRGGEFLHTESKKYIFNYLDNRPLAQKIFDIKRNDWAAYQARELSYLFDIIDAYFIKYSIKLGLPHFYSISYFIGLVAILPLSYSICIKYLRLRSPLIFGLLAALFLTAPSTFFSGFFLRSAKILTAVFFTLIFYILLKLLRDLTLDTRNSKLDKEVRSLKLEKNRASNFQLQDPTSSFKLPVPFYFIIPLSLLMSVSDRQGYFFLLSLTFIFFLLTIYSFFSKRKIIYSNKYNTAEQVSEMEGLPLARRSGDIHRHVQRGLGRLTSRQSSTNGKEISDRIWSNNFIKKSETKLFRKIFLLFFVSTIFALIYTYYLGPLLIKSFTGVQPDFTYMKLDFKDWIRQDPRPEMQKFDKKILSLFFDSTGLFFDTIGYYFGNIHAVVVIGLVLFATFILLKTKDRLTLLICFNSFLLILIMYFFMVVKHPSILWPGIRYMYYNFPTNLIILFFASFVIGKMLSYWPKDKAVIVFILFVMFILNILALPDDFRIIKMVNAPIEHQYAPRLLQCLKDKNTPVSFFWPPDEAQAICAALREM